MGEALKLGKNSIGVGDRFARQAEAQLRACIMAAQQGLEVTPVWNKSNREHLLIGSEPASTRAAADAAVKALGWTGTYYVDADHIGLETLERFLPYADFYTIDVADWIGRPADRQAVGTFLDRHSELIGRLSIPGVEQPLKTRPADLESIANKYLSAARQAGRIYRRIAEMKGEGRFITEVSMDEIDRPQTPAELLVILAALADEAIPLQTIAPKFSGRFNKGVDYEGDVAQFEKEFSEDVAVVNYAVRRYGLPAELKLSVHSGSDKFSLYGPMRHVLRRFNAGVHLKTAGTSWLEELISLAEAGGSSLALVKEIYSEALGEIDELCRPYATVIDIDRRKLPRTETVKGWSPEQFVSALQHDPSNKAYNPGLRQLLHVAYKIAARKGNRYLDALGTHAASVRGNVTANLFERHLKPLFTGLNRG